jgi:hypothetical protein
VSSLRRRGAQEKAQSREKRACVFLPPPPRSSHRLSSSLPADEVTALAYQNLGSAGDVATEEDPNSAVSRPASRRSRHQPSPCAATIWRTGISNLRPSQSEESAAVSSSTPASCSAPPAADRCAVAPIRPRQGREPLPWRRRRCPRRHPRSSLYLWPSSRQSSGIHRRQRPGSR